MKKLIAVSVALSLAGCATVYVPADSRADNFAVAKYECMRESQPQGSFSAQGSQQFVEKAAGIVAAFAAISAANNFQACMAAHGWIPAAR